MKIFFFLHGLADERAEMISMDRMGQLLDAVTWLGRLRNSVSWPTKGRKNRFLGRPLE
jgi:hypothetical protein